MFNRTKKFLDLFGASCRTAHALENGTKLSKIDLEIIGIEKSSIQKLRK